jgi:hypothetical protein
MKQSIKKFVAGFQLNRRKGNLDWDAFEFPGALSRPKHVLVCLPDNLRQLTLVKQFLPSVTDLFKSADITLLAAPGVKIADIFLAKRHYIKFLQ